VTKKNANKQLRERNDRQKPKKGKKRGGEQASSDYRGEASVSSDKEKKKRKIGQKTSESLQWK